MQRANLDWKRGFVGTGNDSGERKTYELTEKGKDLLMKLQTSSI